MAATTTAFETEILGLPLGVRGVMAGAAYKLRRLYLDGVTDPTAHALAKSEQRDVDTLTLQGKLASFDAITAP